MSVRALLIIVLVYLHLFVGNVPSALLTNEYLLHIKTQSSSYKIAEYIDKKNCKDKLYLEYKSFEDLHETCSIVKDLTQKDQIFTTSDVLSIIIKESRFDQYALNKHDGGKGLGQLTAIDINWKDEMPWLTDPYNKHQNIKGILVALNTFYKQYGSKYQAIKHYNGSTSKSDIYAKSVIGISNSIKDTNKL